MKNIKKEKKLTKKENMFSNPKQKSPEKMFSKIFSSKQISPLNFDKLTILVGKGSSFSKKRSVNVKLSFRLKDIYRHLKMKNIPRGTTTSREATPLGDPRGVPKQFSTFWSFSKHFPQRDTKRIPKSLPICLEGFRNRSKQSYHSVLQRIVVDKSVSILVLKARTKNIEIQLNLNMSENTENPLLGHLFDLIESTDFALSGDEGPAVDLNELWSSLPSEPQDNLNTVTSEEFIFPEIQSTIVDSSLTNNIDQEMFMMEESEVDLLPQHEAPDQPPAEVVLAPVETVAATPHYNVTLPVPPTTQILVQIPGTNYLQLVTLPHNNIVTTNISHTLPTVPETPSSSGTVTGATSTIPSSPSTSLSSPSSSLSPSTALLSHSTSLASPSSSYSPDNEYAEMRRKNNEACKNYRQRKKTKQELAEEELNALQQENDLLNMKVRQMESIIKDLRAKVITDITQPRGIRRQREGDRGSDDQTENKRMRRES